MKVSLFHLICCLLGMGIVTINFTFSQNEISEIILYSVFSVIVAVGYIVFGYKFIADDYDESFNIKNYIQIWFPSLILVLISAIGDVATAVLINMPFQPMGALLNELFNEKILCFLLSIIPSTLLQLGYIIRSFSNK